MNKFSRRNFLKTTGLAGTAVFSAPVFMNEITEKSKLGTYRVPSKNIPFLAEYDVVVCGGGPSGCAAAISASRLGTKTLLLEKEGHPGGSPVSQLVAVILSSNGVDFQGIWHEWALGLKEYKGIRELANMGDFWSSVNPEMVKRVWEELLTQSGVEILYHSYTSSAIVENKTIEGVIAETRAGTVGIRAKRVIDCTGDGIVCHQAGVTWQQGDGTHKYAMALTKVFRIANIKDLNKPLTSEEMIILDEKLNKAIAQGVYKSPVITTKSRLLGYIKGKNWRLPEERNEYLNVISRVIRTNPIDPWELSAAERTGRQQAYEAADFYCKNVPGFENAYLLDTSNQIGIRSSRRIDGIQKVSASDALNFVKYPDSIARSSWHIDVWPAESYTAVAVDRESDEAKKKKQRLNAGEYFDIRYGCIVAKGIDNLLMAGRCLSAEHYAEASLRIQQTCMSTGQAAGTAAALSLKNNKSPRELDPMIVVNQLDKDRAATEPAFEVLKNLPSVERKF